MILLALLLAVVQNPNPSVSYSCDGSTAAYTVNFPYLAYTDLVVTSTTVNGAITTLVYTTDYSVNLASTSSTATLTLVSPATKCPGTNTLKISRQVALTQPSSFKAQTTYNQTLHEQAYDRTEMQIQQLNASIVATNSLATQILSGLSVVQPLVWSFTGDGSTISFAIPTATVSLPEMYQVTIDGVMQKPTTDYSVNIAAQTLVFVAAPALNGSIVARTLGYAAAITVDETTQPGAGSRAPFVNPKATPYFCSGNALIDSTSCLQSAINGAAGGTLVIPPGTYKITDTLTVSSTTRILGLGGTIFMAFSSTLPANGILFNVTASNVVFDNLPIDSTGTSATTTGNKYAIKFAGTTGTHLTGCKVRNSRLTNLPWADVPGVLSTHAIYSVYVDGLTIESSTIDNPSGSAIFMSAVTDAKLINNTINNTGWYSIQMNDLVDGVLAFGNRITGTVSGGRNWGGSFNLMSNSTTGTACGTPGCARIKNVNIIGNYISGVHSYTGAVHIESSSYVNFVHNVMRDITLTDGTPPVYVRPYVRPVAGTNEGPNDNINISDNIMIAKGVNDIGIYADAQSNGGALAYSDGLTIRNNKLFSPDTSNYFNHAIAVHGQEGGWKNVAITGNIVSGSPTDASPVSGLIGTLGAAGLVIDTKVLDNTVTYLGAAANTTHLGIGAGTGTQGITIDHNNVKSFWNGVRLLAGSTLGYIGPNNVFTGSGSADYLFSVGPTVNYGTTPKYGTTIALTGRASNLAATSVVVTGAVGEYRVCATARTTTNGTGTTATLNIIWTDEGGVKTDLVGTWALNAVDVTGQINKCEYIHAAASTNIQVSVTAGTYGTSQYAISATAEKLN